MIGNMSKIEYKNYGNLGTLDGHGVYMYCDKCLVSWGGCMAACECPNCWDAACLSCGDTKCDSDPCRMMEKYFK